MAINDMGVAVGAVQVGSDQVAAVWRAGIFFDLSALFPGALETVDFDVNNAGQIAGAAAYATTERPYVITGGAIQFIDLAGAPGRAFAINDVGQVAGTAVLQQPSPAETDYAFLWTGGVPLNLNSVIDPASGWDLLRATAINDAGWILCDAYSPGNRLTGVALIPRT
ncbi:MAG: hypothetical protein GY711_01770 [bacterium]|nr:hypothetical protein [bacterium]